MNRYDWKAMKGTVVIGHKKAKVSILDLVLKKRRDMWENIKYWITGYYTGHYQGK